MEEGGGQEGGAKGQRDGGPPAEYLDDVRSGKSQMRRPTGENVTSWRWAQLLNPKPML